MTVTAWRIVKAKYAATAMTGAGAKRYPGRWNRFGEAVVYAAGSQSLAILEMLVHLEANDPLSKYALLRIEIPESLIARTKTGRLPRNWKADEIPESTRQFGSEWFTSLRSCVLEIPSVIVDSEMNYLINPLHPHVSKLVIGKAEPFRFNPRLIK